MRVPVLWVSRHEDILARGYADQGLLEAVLDRSLWLPPGAIDYEHHEVRGEFPELAGAVVVLPARHHAGKGDVRWLREQLARLGWSVLILAGDEEWVFPWAKFPESERRRVVIMQPRPEHRGLSLLIPGGWYPLTRERLAPRRAEMEARELDWFFAGQVTHARRFDCVKSLDDLDRGLLIETAGYLQGEPVEDYMAHLASAKVVPCPSGPMTVDTARPLEAMEAGCVPLVDTVTPRGDTYDYWSLLFGEGHPIPTIWDWSEFPQRLASELTLWPSNANRVSAFWQQWKRRVSHRLDDLVRSAAGMPLTPGMLDDRVTAIVTTSPIPSHPSTEVIDETIASIREHFPLAEIVVAIDGVRPQQEGRRSAYDEYVRRLLLRCNFDWHNVVPVVMPEWSHQANCTRAALELVTTPLVLFVEHDTPLVGDVEWGPLFALVESGEANAVRLHHEASILEVHEHLMLDHDTRWIDTDAGPAPVRRTTAWWQRPHLAATAFYRDRIMPIFAESSRTMIEDVLYGVVQSAVDDHGEAAWWDWRLWIYTPEGDIKRSTHTDGRAGDPKYEMWR